MSLSRHPLDELVYKLKHSQERGAIILLGDSVTYDVAKRYQIGKKNQIVNFTTNKASGLIGSYFLLQRYFSKSGKKVNDVIFISTPEFLNFIPKNETGGDQSTGSLYISSTARPSASNSSIRLYIKASK